MRHPPRARSEVRRRPYFGAARVRVVLSLAGTCALALIPWHARAYKPRVELSVEPQHVAVGERFLVTIEASSAELNAKVELPDLGGFAILSEERSSPVSFQFSFGRRSNVRSSTIRRLLLAADKPGEYTLGPAKLMTPSKIYTSNRVKLTVTPGQGGLAGDGQGQPSVDVATPDDHAFIKTTLSKLDPYVGEQVTVSHFLYTRLPLVSAPAVVQEPSMSGFWSHDLLPSTKQSQGTLVQQGQHRFRAYLLRRFALFAMAPGEHVLDPLKVSASVGSGLLGDVRKLTREGERVRLQVKPLPVQKGSAQVFVGQLELTTSIDKRTAKTGEAVALEVVAAGRGNLEQLDIELPAQKGLRVLRATVDDALDVSAGQVGGTRTFRWLLVPQQSGTFSVPPFTKHVFDPETGQTQVVLAEVPQLIATGPSREVDRSGRARAERGENPPALLSPRRKLLVADVPLDEGRYFQLGLLLVLALLASEAVYGHIQMRRRGKVRRGASGAVAAPESVNDELRARIETLIGSPVRGMSADAASSRLEAAGVPAATARAVREHLEAEQAMHFGGTHAGSTATTLDQDAQELITALGDSHVASHR